MSSLAQVIVNKLLQSWGYHGFKDHTDRVAAFYREKRDVFQKAMKKHLEGYAEWAAPEAGMFFWYVSYLPRSPPSRGSEERVQTTSCGLILMMAFISDKGVNLNIEHCRFKLKLNGNEANSVGKDDGDSEFVIRTRAFEKGVLALPGKVFLPNGSRTAYVRASFSLNPEAEVDEALRRLREAVEPVSA